MPQPSSLNLRISLEQDVQKGTSLNWVSDSKSIARLFFGDAVVVI